MTPPRFWRALLSLAAGRDDRADVVADLDDEAAARAIDHGDHAARRWYRRQAARSVIPLLRRRLGLGATITALRRNAGQDVRYAVRTLAASPGYTVAVVLMLAIGIGAHTVVSAVADGLVLRPMPFGDRSARLVTMHAIHPTLAQDWDDSEISYPDLLDLRSAASTLEGLEGAIGRNVSISTGSETERVLGASITAGLFSMLGVHPMLGRDFVAADGAAPGFESSVILSHGIWQSMFGGDRSAVGRSVLMNGRALTVVGVMPPGFDFPHGQQLWLPYRTDPQTGRAARSVLAIGLLRPGSTLAQASADLKGIAAQLSARHPETNRDWGVHLMLLRDFLVSGADATTLLGAVTLVVLAACANVAGLVVARGAGRQRELTLRAALGAGRARLVRLLAIETTMLATAGGLLGLGVATAGIRAIVAWIPETPPAWAMPALDLRVAAFAAGITGITALVAGLIPAIRLSRVDAAGALMPVARVSVGRAHHRLQQALVTGQVAVSLALLVGALVLSRSAAALLGANGGFDPTPLLSLRFYIAGDGYDNVERRAVTIGEIVRRVTAISGVRAAAATGSIPTDDGGSAIRIEPPPAAGGAVEPIGGQLVPASPSLWQTLGLDLVDGRTFTDSETNDDAADVVIVNRRLAERFWPGRSAVGRMVRFSDGGELVPRRVVGVAPDLVYEEFGEETPQSQMNIYVPLARAPWRTQALIVRADGDPAAVATAARSVVRAVDAGFAVFDVMTMADRRHYNHWAAQFIGRTCSAFALAALLLAAIGAYGIAAHSVAQRRREIGIRLAIGASRASVLKQFLGIGGRLAVAGLAIGLPVAAVAVRAIEASLFRVSPWTAGIWIVPPIVLAAAVVAAGYLPALRASRTDPAVVLRSE